MSKVLSAGLSLDRGGETEGSRGSQAVDRVAADEGEAVGAGTWPRRSSVELVEIPALGEVGFADGAGEVVVFDDVALVTGRAASENDRVREPARVIQAGPVERCLNGRPGGEVRAVAGRL